MNKQRKISERQSGPSLDHTLHFILTEIAPVRLAALQVLIYHMETKAGEAVNVTPTDFMEAAAVLRKAHEATLDLVSRRLKPLQITLPPELSGTLEEATKALADLVQITDRCSLSSSGELKGFQPTGDMYGLCIRRAAGSIANFTTGLGAFFLELTERGKADALSKTSTIAMEIGKIGRVINMVATNASIEAARAGDAGRGFTVIADEVKVLSSRVSSLSVSLTDRLNVS